jgi:hypothetical protein
MPAVRFNGTDDLIEWNTVSPRVGLTLALDDARKTVLRASYANYAEQLSFANAAEENPIASGYLAFEWNDRNGDRIVQPNEVNLLDNDVVLGRFRQANSGAFTATASGAESGKGRIEEILAPRVARLGLTLTF